MRLIDITTAMKLRAPRRTAACPRYPEILVLQEIPGYRGQAAVRRKADLILNLVAVGLCPWPDTHRLI